MSESPENLPKFSFASQKYCVNLSGLETKTSLICSPAVISVLQRNTSFEMHIKLYEAMLQRICQCRFVVAETLLLWKVASVKHKQNLNAEKCSSIRNKQIYLKHRKYSTAVRIIVVFILSGILLRLQKIARKFILNSPQSIIYILYTFSQKIQSVSSGTSHFLRHTSDTRWELLYVIRH